MKIKNETLRFSLMVLFALSLLIVQHLTFSNKQQLPQQAPTITSIPGGALLFFLIATGSLAILYVVDVKGKGGSQ
ncbi:hypothetical protein GCM10023189_41570 [Nibrella saemangeumensis]|uniref:DUF3098 domain-containing protein n=1 Tax=Nibrella saemangeumensis TaxID=1084526 RepID=A0ABP8ND72_9BACT